MKWTGRRESGNVDDERSSGGGFGGSGIRIGGGLTIVIVIVCFLLGKNPLQILSALQGDDGTQNSQPYQPSQSEDTLAHFVKVVLADTEDIWGELFSEQGKQYEEPRLVMFRDGVRSACGNESSASGPFYCPADHKVYIDLAFYEAMRDRFHAGGDFAMAYVIAHEVGHHVQNLMGISDKVQQQRENMSEEESNRLSVKVELQADFLAGVWAHYDQKTKNVLEEGDFEEALNAANAIGDDRLQMQSQGHVVPDAFTHGTSAQRMYWFKKGFDTGDIKQGNTFAVENL